LLPNGRRYLELDADHELMKSAETAYWPILTAAVAQFRAEPVSTHRGTTAHSF
jgi:hypothetical protein